MATQDPIIPHSPSISAYMSVHSATNLAYVKYYAKATNAVSATFKSIDSTGFVVSYKEANGVEKDARINFKEPLTKREEIRTVLQDMAKEAEEALGLPSTLTGPPPIAAIAKAVYASVTNPNPSSLYGDESLDIFKPIPLRRVLPVMTCMGSIFYLAHATSPPTWAASFRDLFPAFTFRAIAYFFYVTHALEAAFAFGVCMKRGVYSWKNTALWTLQGLIVGYDSTMAIIAHGKVIDEVKAKKQ